MEKLTIKGRVYEHLKNRVYTPISIYKGTDTFLRIGQPDLIKEELEQHKKLLSYGFPIAEIIDEGTYDGKYYYIEKSLGSDAFNVPFKSDYDKLGAISDANFEKMLSVIETFAGAQLKTVAKGDYWAEFEKSRSVDLIIEELPQLKDEIVEVVSRAKQRLKIFPYVLTHGDFNSYNIFEKGVIDMEGVSYGSAGYDLISNIYHVKFFPRSGDYEYIRGFDYTQEQTNAYLARLDNLYKEHNLPALSQYANVFLLFRMTWSAARMQTTPKIQQWRYDLLARVFEEYLRGGSVVDILQ